MKYWLTILFLVGLAAWLMLVFVFPALGAQPTVTLSVIPYPVTATVSWTPQPNVCVYDVYFNGREYDVPRTHTSLIFSNLTGPATQMAYMRIYTTDNRLSDFSEATVTTTPIRTWKLNAPTNCIIQGSSDFKSWISVPSSTVTNDWKNHFYRATTIWP